MGCSSCGKRFARKVTIVSAPAIQGVKGLVSPVPVSPPAPQGTQILKDTSPKVLTGDGAVSIKLDPTESGTTDKDE